MFEIQLKGDFGNWAKDEHDRNMIIICTKSTFLACFPDPTPFFWGRLYFFRYSISVKEREENKKG